jgi:hypothetical protein
MDMIVVLDDFAIAPGVGVVWGEERSRLHQTLTRFTFRVNANDRVRLFVNTSGVRYDVSTEQAASVTDAIDGIREARRLLAINEQNASGRFAASAK